MQRILSTYRWVGHRLTPALLGEIAKAEIPAVEVFCATGHFHYRLEDAVRDLAGALSEHGLHLHALHSPTERDSTSGHQSGVQISISDTERIRRIDAVDEVKRALEVAERIPFQYLIQHMGSGRQSADPRKLDAAFESLENLSNFAKHRGVTIALENKADELGCPATLHQFIQQTHLQVKFCFDTGHAHIEGGVGPGFELMRERVVSVHVHDNHGEKDEHLLPSDGTIDWDQAFVAFASAPEPPALVLELKEKSPGTPKMDEIRAAFDRLEELSEK
ncbi:MAG TPA: sugar phosphate isomerase/epimerase family protein [Candidatus Dormibacteraeota bacterium]|nr:sugar phosphate isomerase/epimerase family protein [Candidatus Dormibacteraeota bacterium]